MKKSLIILCLCLYLTFPVSGGENPVIGLTEIETDKSSGYSEVKLVFDNILNKFTTKEKDNNLIIDIMDCELLISDTPMTASVDAVSIIQPMQLKKNPSVTRVVMVMSDIVEYKSFSESNTIRVVFEDNMNVSERTERLIDEEITDILTEREEPDGKGAQDFGMASDPVSVSEPNSDKGVEPSNINFNFSGMSLKEIFETLSNLTGYNIILDGGVKEKEMNLFIQDLALNEALDLVVTSAGLSKHRFNANTFIITEKERARDMLARKEQRMFKLSNAEADEVISLIQGNKILADKIKRENLSADERINAILAYDTPENLALIEKIIGDFDKKNGQVTIELHLVEMKREDLNNFGFTYDQFPISPKSMDLMNLPSSVKIYTKLEALVSEEKANILSSPKIRVVHKKPAKIRIGDEIPVPYFTYEEAHKYVNTQSSRDNDVRVVEPLKKFTRADVGIDLKVTPYIHDNNEVSMDLDVSISDLIKVDNDGQLYTSSRDTQTFVRLKDRETAVLGGLIKQEERNEESRVPGFQRIPILRHLFKNRKKTKKNMEMLMFITPYFVNKDKEPEKIADKSRETDIDRKTTPDTDREYYNVIGELKKISD